jgi:hypothetical protein
MKNKILVIAPYGMTLRQIVLNKVFWEYLCDKYEVHVKTSVEIKNYNDLGIDKIILPKKGIFISLLVRLHTISKSSKILDFLIENNLGEHLVFRLKHIDNFAKTLYVSYFLDKLLNIAKVFGVDKLKYYLAVKASQVKKENYVFVLATHISETMCELEAIAAKKINVPVITYTLGMDNYRHGRILFKPDLILMWGYEQKYEFDAWHRNDFNSINDIKCEVVGNLIYDSYLQHAANNKLKQYIKNRKENEYEGYLLVPTMSESILPGGYELVKTLIKYLKDRKLNYLIIVRTLPGSADQKLWQQLEQEYINELLVYEPSVVSFDKRGAVNVFRFEEEMQEVEIFSAMLLESSLVVNLYPSSVTLDAYLFNTPVIFPLFDWVNPNNERIKEHSFTKVLFSKFATHPYHREFNPVLSYDELFKAMDDIIIEGNFEKYVGKHLFKQVCGNSKDMNVGKRTVKAIENFIGS